MPFLGNIKRWFAVLLAGSCLGTPGGNGANIPVFRCALEEWPAQNYQAVVFHRGPLEATEQELVGTLASAPAKTGVNLLLSTVDVRDEMAEPMQSLWSAQTNAEPPWLVILAPPASTQREPSLVWAGRLQAEPVGAILDSPARRKIVDGLLRGDSAVWVLLECGEAVRDEAAVDLLAGSLKQLEAGLRLPAFAAGSSPLKSPLPLQIGFSLVRVTRTDPAEEFLVSLLLEGESPDRAKPVAFPVFGRGRVLDALTGKHLQIESIKQTGAWLASACTNGLVGRGRDLLLSANWSSIFQPSPPPETNAASVAQIIQIMTNAANEQVAVTPAKTASSPANRQSSAGGIDARVSALIAAGLAAGIFLALRLRGKR